MLTLSEISLIEEYINKLEEEIVSIDSERNKDDYNAKMAELNDASLKYENLKIKKEELSSMALELSMEFESLNNELDSMYDQVFESTADLCLAYEEDIANAYGDWDQESSFVESLQEELKELIDEKRKYEESQKKRLEELDYYKNCLVSTTNYKNALKDYEATRNLFALAETSLEQATSTYNELSSVIDEYKQSQSQEPEVTEVTTKNTFTTKISQTLRGFFTGVTAVVDGTITTNTTTVTKTITDKVTTIKKTIVSTKVNVIANACVKIYDRCGRLITTLHDAVNIPINWVCAFFGF